MRSFKVGFKIIGVIIVTIGRRGSIKEIRVDFVFLGDKLDISCLDASPPTLKIRVQIVRGFVKKFSQSCYQTFNFS